MSRSPCRRPLFAFFSPYFAATFISSRYPDPEEEEVIGVWRSAASGISFPRKDSFFVEKVISYDSLALLIDKEFRNNDGICALLWMYIDGI